MSTKNKTLEKVLEMFQGNETKPERVEKTMVTLELDFEAYKKHKKAITQLVPEMEEPRDGGSILLSYQFLIEYFDNITAALKAIQELCEDESIIINANCNRLQETSCVIFDTLEALKQVRKTIKNRRG